jgi:hypothetical protein
LGDIRINWRIILKYIFYGTGYEVIYWIHLAQIFIYTFVIIIIQLLIEESR